MSSEESDSSSDASVEGDGSSGKSDMSDTSSCSSEPLHVDENDISAGTLQTEAALNIHSNEDCNAGSMTGLSTLLDREDPELPTFDCGEKVYIEFNVYTITFLCSLLCVYYILQVRTTAGLVATVTAVHSNGTYDIKYIRGDEDIHVLPIFLKKWEPLKRKRQNSKPSWEVVEARVETAEEYFKRTEISESAMLPPDIKRGRRR